MISLTPNAQLQRQAAEMRTRLIRVGGLLGAVLAIGTAGYYMLGDGLWSGLDCLYMTIITLTTVGYGEVLPVDRVPGARVFTIFIIVAGMGAVLYFVSTLTAFIVEGTVESIFTMRKMHKTINDISRHTLVCGIGRTGRHVVEELVGTDQKCVVIDQDGDVIERFIKRTQKAVPVVVGDATQDEVLIEAGVRRADAIVITLTDEIASLYCVLSARQLNREARIIVTSDNLKAEQKFKHAGADSVIYTAIIGGRRIASEIVRPDVVSFLDLMTNDPDHTLRFEQITVPEGSELCGTPLARSGIRDIGDVLVVATLDPGGRRYHYNPGPTHVIRPGEILIVLGHHTEIARVRTLILGREG